MRRLVLLSGFILLSFCLLAQQGNKQYNSLLWRITGNGLTKPSYLYGTMHLTDKKLFYFGDSLYKALEQCEGFAAELDMSSFATDYINFMMGAEDSDDNKRLLQDMVEEKKLDRYKTKLEKKFGKSVDKITAKDIDKEEKSRTDEILSKGEMKTFMDAYLYDIAYKQGKWTGGIEDFADQMEYKDESLEEKLEGMFTSGEKTDKTIQWMMDVYLKQDLELIDRTDELWRGSKDLLLLKRNGKMSRRMDSLSHIRSCLFAVGAAHIPGDSGVVSLLRQRGFIVTPVSSSKKIAPEKYTYTKVDRPWINVGIQDSLYSLQMPGKAEVFKIFEDMPFDMKMYFDMGSLVMYLTVGVRTAHLTEKGRDSMLAKVGDRYHSKNSDFKEKDIVIGAHKGKEFSMKNEYGEFRIQAFIPGDFLAINGVFALKKESLAHVDADRFFRSFKSNNMPPLKQVPDGERWQTYTFNEHAFAISFPGKYRSKKEKDEEEGWNQKTFELLDLAGNAYYGVFVGETKEGYYSSEDSAYFNRVRESLETGMKAEMISSRKFEMKGFPAFEGIMKTEEDNEEVNLKLFMLNRGNRRYFLLASFDPAKPAAADKFLSSFTLLPLPETKWQQEMPTDKSFRIWAPSPVSMQVDSTSQVPRYRVFDAGAPISIYVDKNVLSPYYWAANDSLVFANRIQTFVGYGDSLVGYKQIKNGNIKGVDLLIRLGETHNIKKMRLLLNADTVYTIYGFLPNESLETANYQKLFDEFRITTEVQPAKVYERRPETLLKALQSEDSVVYEQAWEAFGDVQFERQDIPLLQRSLLHHYNRFEDTYYSSSNFNEKIASKIIQLDSNHTSISFIRDNYNKIEPGHEEAKLYLLSILSSIKTQASYDLLKELIVKHPPKIDKEVYFSNRLYDSIKLTRRLYPEILSMSADTCLSWLINGVTIFLLDSNLLTRNDLLTYKNIFVNYAKKELARPKEELEENAYDYYQIVRLLGALNLPEANVQLNRFGKLSDRGLRMQVIAALLRNNQPVDRKDIYTIATTDQYRSELYEELKKLKKTAMFPIDYLTQKHLGQSVLYEYAADDDEPKSLNYIGERIEMYKGKKQKFYLYKVAYAEMDPKSQYLGIAGPYPLDQKNYESSHDATGIWWDDNYDIKKLNELFKKYMDDLEESESEN